MRTAPGMFATGLLVCITAVPLAAGIVLMSDHSPALPVAIAIAIAGAAAMLLTRDLTRAMFLGFLVVLPFDISKALLPPDTVYYYPGFWLSISDLFLLGFLLPWFFGRKLIGREPFLTNPLVPFAIVYTAYLWVSALMAVSPTHGMVMALTHTKFLVAFLAISDYVRKPADLHAAGLAFAAGLVIELTIVAAQLVTRSYLQIPGTGLADTGNLTFSGGIQTFRPTGFLKHPIALADYLVFMLLPGAALVLAGRRSIGRAWGFILLLTLGAGIALVATLSRGGWIAFFVAMSFLMLTAAFRRAIPMQWIGAAIVGLVVLLSVTAVAYPVAYLRLVESDQRSSEGRGFMNEQALLIATGKPVFGVGLGGYHRAAKSIKPVSFASADQRLREALVNFLGIVHNKYLLVFAEHGAVGLVLLFLLLWKSIRLFFRVPVWNNRVQELVGLGLAGALVTQAVFYLFDHFYLEVGLMLFWVFAAGLAALGRMQGPGPAMKTGVA